MYRTLIICSISRDFHLITFILNVELWTRCLINCMHHFWLSRLFILKRKNGLLLNEISQNQKCEIKIIFTSESINIRSINNIPYQDIHCNQTHGDIYFLFDLTTWGPTRIECANSWMCHVRCVKSNQILCDIFELASR